MAGINVGRVIGGGLVAGLVMNVVDGVTNGVILTARWDAESKRLGLDMSQQPQALAGWLTYGFLCGIVLVFITHLAFAAWVFNGLYSFGIVAASTVGGLVAAVAGGLAGCALYKEA